MGIEEFSLLRFGLVCDLFEVYRQENGTSQPQKTIDEIIPEFI